MMISYRADRTIVECQGDIAVAWFGPNDDWATIRLSDDYGQREPGADFREEDYAPVKLAECSGVLIAIKDPRSARTLERAARRVAEVLEERQRHDLG